MNNNKVKKTKLSFSICLPIYKGSNILRNCLNSILNQTFDNFEIIIGDDNTPGEDDTEIKNMEKILDEYNDSRIQYIKNEKNLGYALNLMNIVKYAKNDVLFLAAHDDIFSKNSLNITHDALLIDENIGCVTRPYFWFDEETKRLIRAVLPPDINSPKIMNIQNKEDFNKIFESVGQLSGLAFIKEFIEEPFNDECFPAHIYPFASILRNHKCVFLNEYTVAVGISNSQTRKISSIYDISPTESWINMYKKVFEHQKYKKQLTFGINHICKEHLGLFQIKNFAKPGLLFREIKLLVKYRPLNIFSVKFLIIVVVTSLIPRVILIKLIDKYKLLINSIFVKSINTKNFTFS